MNLILQAVLSIRGLGICGVCPPHKREVVSSNPGSEKCCFKPKLGFKYRLWYSRLEIFPERIYVISEGKPVFDAVSISCSLFKISIKTKVSITV